MAVTKAEIAAALGTTEATLDTTVGLVKALADAGLTEGAVAAWAGTMSLAAVGARLDGWSAALSTSASATATARQTAAEAIAAARARVDEARAAINSGGSAEDEQAAVLALVTAAGQATGAYAAALGAQAAAVGGALG